MGEVRRLWIAGPAGRLEAALRLASPARAAAVVAHPHPLHGGTLDHPVVFHADRELNRAGLTTMRFNFRGVGGSEGSHDDGRGELDDLAAAVGWLRGLVEERPLLAVGYSFGAWCAARLAARESRIAGVIGIGLPVARFAFDALEQLGRPLAVVQGEHDEFGGPEAVRALLRRCRPPGKLHVVSGSSHLFAGRAPQAGDRTAAAAEAMLAELPRR